MKRIFEIEYPDDHGPMWMNRDNLLICLTTEFTVTDVTGDGALVPMPATAKASPRNMQDLLERIHAVRQKAYAQQPLIEPSLIEEMCNIMSEIWVETNRMNGWPIPTSRFTPAGV